MSEVTELNRSKQVKFRDAYETLDTSLRHARSMATLLSGVSLDAIDERDINVACYALEAMFDDLLKQTNELYKLGGAK